MKYKGRSEAMARGVAWSVERVMEEGEVHLGGEQNGKDEHLGKGEGQEGGQNYHPRGERLERGELGTCIGVE